MAEKLVKTGYAENGNTAKPIKLYVTYSYTQDIEKNQTTITCGMKVTTPSSTYYIGPWSDFDGSYVGKSSLTFDGAIAKFAGTKTLTSGKKFTVTHNDAGEATATIAWKWGVRSSWGGFPSNNNGSFTITLPVIPRKATLSTATNFTDEENPKITFSNPAGNAVEYLGVSIRDELGTTGYVAYKTDISKTGSSYTFSLTSSERDVLRKAASDSNTLNVRFYIKTTLGGVDYYHYLPRTLTIVNANPIVTGTVEDANDTTYALTGDRKKLIKYYSNAKATLTATPQKEATINESLYNIGNGSNSSSEKEYTFNNVESNVFTFSAEDSRKNYGLVTVEPSMVKYVKLTCNISNDKPDGNGNMSISCYGNYFNGSFGKVSNTLTVQYRYKSYGGTYGSWTNMTATKSGNTYTASASLTGLDYQQTYSFETRAIDKLATVKSKVSTVKSAPIFHWGEGDFSFEVPVSIQGNEVKDFVVDYGTASMGSNGTWYWSKWASGKAECYGCRNYGNIGCSTAWGSLYQSTSFTQSLPTGLFKAAPEYISITPTKISSGAFWVMHGHENDTTANSTGSFFVCRPTSLNISQAYLGFHIIGRCK